jgi:hypothetical protein
MSKRFAAGTGDGIGADQRAEWRKALAARAAQQRRQRYRPRKQQQAAGPGMVRLTTTQRGLGYDHQLDRKRQLAALRDGDPCPRCGGPMFRGQYLDLDDFPGRIFGGPQVKLLAHRYCNRRAGSRQREAAKRLRASRTW